MVYARFDAFEGGLGNIKCRGYNGDLLYRTEVVAETYLDLGVLLRLTSCRFHGSLLRILENCEVLYTKSQWYTVVCAEMNG